MLKPNLVRQLLLMGALAVAAATPALADQVLYDSTGFLVGQQSFTDSLTLSGPGTLTVTLTDMAWPEQLASLNSVVSSSSGLLGPEMGAGTQSFQVTGGPVVVQWFGTAQGALDAGVYGMEIQFQSTTPVPLPTSIALLLSGLLMLVWQRRSRKTSEPDEPIPG
jgi:hypothetical protein